jgi:hypothetical protein
VTTKRVERAAAAMVCAVFWMLAGCQPSTSLAPPGVTTPSDALAMDPWSDEAPAEETVAHTEPAGEPEPAAPTEPAETDVADRPAETGVPETPSPSETVVASRPEVAMPNLVAIEIALPHPAFRGTPVPLKEPNVEKPLGRPRPPFLAPEGTELLSRGMPVVASDPAPPAGELDYIVDGDKEASDFGLLELSPGTQWVQVDLGRRAAIYAILMWHNHAEGRVYRDVVVQVGDDPDMLDAVTVFNNDYDNTSGLGIGEDMGYVETAEGKLIDAGGVEGRYVRFYSRGSDVDDKNHYTEVEVFGRPLDY